MICRKFFLGSVLLVFLLASCSSSKMEQLEAIIFSLTESGPGEAVGKVVVSGDKNKIVLDIQVTSPLLKEGDNHGFHIHEKADLSSSTNDKGVVVVGGGAGGHWDPELTEKHLGPHGGGHRGDMPFLTVISDGEINEKVEVEGLTIEDLKGRAIIIHAGGDNYSDNPKPLGGGGERIFGANFNN